MQTTPPQHTDFIRIITSEEFRAEKKTYDHHQEILSGFDSIRYCKAETFADCILGTIRVPRKSSQKNPRLTFGFYLTADSLTLIDDSGRMKKYYRRSEEHTS